MSKWTAESDVDYRNEVCGLSRADEELRIEREEEALREQRWAAFVAIIRSLIRRNGVEYIFMRLAQCQQRSVGNRSGGAIGDFAGEEGWPNVLRAIARAMEEEEQYRNELVDRR